MKKLFTLLAALLLTASVFAQSPEKMSYQAVIRNSSDVLVTNTQVGMQISILQGSPSGSPIYVEAQTPTTNANGLVSIEIGTGTTSDDFTTIDWANGSYFIKTEIDPAGSTNYTITGTSQLLSVPFALYAKTAETVAESDPLFTAWDKSTGIAITESQVADLQEYLTEETQTLSISGSQLTIENGNTITLPAGGSSSLPLYTTTEIAALSPAQGDAVFNSTENLYQVYVNSAWQSFNAICWPQPTTAYAGTNQTFTDGTVTATLAANSPEAEHGTGAWTIISGTGGSFDDATNPKATFTGQLDESYELQWSILTSCAVSSDNVNVFFVQPITDIDGNIYQTVKLGNQIWMAENLKTTKYNDGTDIPLIKDGTVWGNLTTPGYCWYNNDQATYGEIYGALYNWYTVETGNLCPAGWHVPTDEEWKTLEMYLGMSQAHADGDGWRGTDEGGKLKETGTTHWNSPNTGATNESGFTALPGGSRSTNGPFYSIGDFGLWWSATEHLTLYASTRYIGYNTSIVYRNDYVKDYGFSVRCVKESVH